jgi:excisionase family DNA binding protein
MHQQLPPEQLDSSRVLTVAEVAGRLRVSPGAIYAAIQAGRLRAFRFGTRGRGTYRVTEENLRQYLESCTVMADSPSFDTSVDAAGQRGITLPRHPRHGRRRA